MARSYDSRRHPTGPPIQPGGLRALRGPKRIGPIRGIVPGDDVEVAREIARLWQAMRSPVVSGSQESGCDCPTVGGLKRFVKGNIVSIYTAKSSLEGWWRMGDRSTQDNPFGDDFEWADSSGNLRPFILNSSYSPGVGGVAIRGDGPDQLGASDDKATAFAGGGYANTQNGDWGALCFNENQPFTISMWVALTIQNSCPSPVDRHNGLLFGTIRMDNSGSYNVGVGFTYSPYVLLDTGGPPCDGNPNFGLQFWRYAGGSSLDKMYFPVPLYGSAAGGWWDANGFDFGTVSGLSVRTPNQLASSSDFTQNPWIHVAVTYDGSMLRGYVNGVRVTSKSATYDMSTGENGADLQIGGGAFDTGVTEYAGSLHAGLDEVAIWSECLTPAEILEIYRAGGDPTGEGRWVDFEIDSASLGGEFWASHEKSARIYKETAPSISDNSEETVTMDTARYDTGVLWDSTDPNKLFAPESGRYAVGATAEWAANSTGQRELRLRANGSDYIASTRVDAAASGVTRQSVYGEWELEEGEYVELRAFQNRGGGSSLSCTAELFMHRIT